MPRFAPDDLQRFTAEVLRAGGATERVATGVAAHLVESNLKGVDSHGVGRIPYYLEIMGNGFVDPRAEPVVERDDAQLIRVYGAGGFGIVALEAALEALLAERPAPAIAVAGITNCGHTGRIGSFAERAAAAGRFALILGGGGRQRFANTAPYGGARGVLSTNPYALALPGGRYGPVVVDFATSATAQGKLMLARAKGETLAPGTILDKDGVPSRNPEDFYAGGAILPAAGPKGYGLALIAELIGNALLGAPQEFNWLMILLDLERFRAFGDYQAAAEAILADVKAVPPQEGFDEVCLPGELEARRAEDRRRAGVPIDPEVWAGITEAVAGLDVAPPTALV